MAQLSPATEACLQEDINAAVMKTVILNRKLQEMYQNLNSAHWSMAMPASSWVNVLLE